MTELFSVLNKATEPAAPERHRHIFINEFAEQLNWKPSYILEDYRSQNLNASHLIVEHGLEHTSVLSFLHGHQSVNSLSRLETNHILEASYNNLISNHILIGRNDAAFCSNLQKYGSKKPLEFSVQGIEVLERSNVSNLFPSADKNHFLDCDDALIKTISNWKRLLIAELSDAISIDQISLLFNAIFFIRAIEDYQELTFGPQTDHFYSYLTQLDDDGVNLGASILDYYEYIDGDQNLSNVLDVEKLRDLPTLGNPFSLNLVKDFYKGQLSPYRFNFAFMSKHALSRIYERYVTIFATPENNPQVHFDFASELPQENALPDTGTVYTPEFISTFFAKYVIQEMPPKKLRNVTVIDPACGSGIFIRTFAERIYEYALNTGLSGIGNVFDRLYGIDNNPNAIEAARLSLALLHLILTGRISSAGNLLCEEATSYLSNNEQENTFDVIVGNPPYVRLDDLNTELKERYIAALGEYSYGRIDAYLAFLKVALDRVNPGGFICFVLPQSFLMSKNARLLRQRISKEFHIRCLLDLSQIEVFETVGAYVVLLVVQKPMASAHAIPAAQIGRIKAFPSLALDAVISDREIENPYYFVYETPQSDFSSEPWVLHSPTDIRVRTRISRMSKLGDFAKISQGYVSGADDVFLVNKNDIPKGEERLYRPVAQDRKMRLFQQPKDVSIWAFYPFVDARKLSETEVKKHFPKTWEYLSQNHKRLSERGAVTSGKGEWWRPLWPRDPSAILSNKLLTPHLCISPRFSLDLGSGLLPLRSPFIYIKGNQKISDMETSLLKLFCACLNSSVGHWYLSRNAFIYGRGYMRLEVSTLKGFPVPDPNQSDHELVYEIVELVDAILNGNDSSEVVDQIDQKVYTLYGMPPQGMHALGQ